MSWDDTLRSDEPVGTSSPGTSEDGGGRSTSAPSMEPLIQGLPGVRLGPVTKIDVTSVVLGDTPRIGGEDAEHWRLLAQSDAALPPIIVHRESMEVIDGMHRLVAARERGVDSIAARFIEGSTEDVFVVSVRANTTHGKPLTLAERERSAERILHSHPDWSDRSIAEVCGLSAKKIGALRPRATDDDRQSHMRVGRDGRVRPMSTDEGRKQAAEILTQTPKASLREVARRAGISPGTVRDVRDRIRRGDSPLPSRSRVIPQALPTPRSEPNRRWNGFGAQGGGGTQTATTATTATTASTGHRTGLDEDNALLSTSTGRTFLEWMSARAIDGAEWSRFVDEIPASRIYLIVDRARAYASAWTDFADALEARVMRKRK